MKRSALLLNVCLLQSLAGVALAQTVYRCGEPGNYVFSTEPCGDAAKTIQIEVPQASKNPNPYKNLVDDYKKNLKSRAEQRANQPKRQPAPSQRTNGLSLREFTRIRNGMSEGEVIFMAGLPDSETVDSINTDIGITRKSYYYIKRGFNGNVSRIFFVNGNVVNTQRELIKNP